MTAQQMMNFLRALYALILFMLVYIIIVISLTWTTNKACRTVLDQDTGALVQTCDSFSFGSAYDIYQVCMISIQIIFSVLMTIIFLIEFHRMDRNFRSAEQKWTIVLLVFTTLWIIPWSSIIGGFNYYNVGQDTKSTADELNNLIDSSVYEAFFTYLTSYTGIVFFGWCTAASYRSLDKTPTSWTFYFPKILVILLLVALRIVLSTLMGLRPAATPGASLPLIIIAFIIVGKAEYKLLGVALIFAVTEVLVVVEMVAEMVQTASELRKIDYFRYRSKQIGFKFFEYHFGVTLASMILYEMLIFVATPFGNIDFLFQYSGYFYLDLNVGDEVLGLILVAFVCQQAIINSPAGVHSFRALLRDYTIGCCRPGRKTGAGSAGDDDSTTMLLERADMHKMVYMISESKGDVPFIIANRIMTGPRTFSLDSMVQAYNCAWLTFSFGKEGKKTRSPKELGDAHYEMVDYISAEQTDTHALILQKNDRIVVAFKGTTSLSNVYTDVSFQLVPLDELFKRQPDSIMSIEHSMDSSLHSKMFSALSAKVFKSTKPKIHSGFLFAYLSVAERIELAVESLYKEKPRPIFFTGHSLGGALSTLSSYSIRQKLRLSEDNIACYTFGSPMVGNHAFTRKYDSKVPRHWRVVLEGDAVTKLPVGPFDHVGFKALLTDEGMLFIDPSLMELTWNHSKGTSFQQHVKSRYEKAMQQVCDVHHKGIKPIFWSKTAKKLIREEKLANNAEANPLSDGESESNTPKTWSGTAKKLSTTFKVKRKAKVRK
mmetsp:Transcript_10598/g.27803  ORF Transcript_10598/g.27803 Transcript_10598/m.27803 type:complete len:770 (-) Transcript_10598:33-2342(-)